MRPLFISLSLSLLLTGTAHAQSFQQAPVQLSPAERIEQLIQGKKFDAALKRADEHLIKNPRDAQVRFLRGVIFSDQGKTDEAVKTFEALSQDFPELPEPYNNLAVLIASQGRLDQARTLLLRSIEAQPNYVTAHENLGDLYVSLAVESYEKATKLAPGKSATQNKLKLARELNSTLRGTR